MTTARQKTDGAGRFLFFGLDFTDQESWKANKRALADDHVYKIKPSRACVGKLGDALSGILYPNTTRRDFRHELLARTALEQGYKAEDQCYFGAGQNILILRIGKKEFRKHRNLIYERTI